MEQFPNAPVVVAADLNSMAEPIAPKDASPARCAPLCISDSHTASIEASDMTPVPVFAITPTAVAPSSITTSSQQHNAGNSTDKTGHTVLMQRAISGDVCGVQALVAAGVDVNMRDEAGLSAVAYAAVCGHRGVVQVLLAAKAAPVVVTKGIAALVKRVCNGEQAKVGVLRALLRIKPMLRGAEYMDDEDEVVEGEEYGDVDWGYEDTYEEATDEQPGHHFSDEEEDKAAKVPQLFLYSAAKRGYVDVVKLLLAAGANMRQRCCEEFTPDMESTMNALHIASERGHVKVVKVLLAAGATEIIDAPADMCEFESPFSCEGTQCRNVSALYIAVYHDHIAVARLLVAAGAKVNAEDDNGWTPLHRACHNGNVAIVEMLLAAGADVDAENDDGDTPLHIATVTGSVESVELLLAAGANVNAKEYYGTTSLFVAVDKGCVDMVKVLLGAGADVNVRDRHGNTMLHVSALKNTVPIVKLLIPAGVDLTAKNNYGNTALHRAACYNQMDMLKALLDPDVFCANIRVTDTANEP